MLGGGAALSPLAVGILIGAGGQNRTADLRITSAARAVFPRPATSHKALRDKAFGAPSERVLPTYFLLSCARPWGFRGVGGLSRARKHIDPGAQSARGARFAEWLQSIA